jgi:aspartyl-tRNA(Asn)/glutamyl-tRNA(Gln) amidotransferase subunit A
MDVKCLFSPLRSGDPLTGLAQLSAVELERAYAAGETDPVAVWLAVRERMDAWEPVIHATAHRDDEAAESEARAAAERWRSGRPRGPLDGVPVTIKENIATAGVPTPLGTAATELAPAPADAPIAARLREAGAVIVAKTTMPDFGMLSSGVSSLHPTTRNPWNPSWTPGGSSAGAAAAAAAGYGPIHIGTDIGGSIRLPAGWTGVVGFKPSFGRVPLSPPYYGRVAGPLARSVADTARAMAVISNGDDRDHMSLPPEQLAWHSLDGPVAGLRVGLAQQAGAGMSVDPEAAGAAGAVAAALERAGAHVEAVGPLITERMLDGLDRFWRMRSYLDWMHLPVERRDRLLPYLRAWVEPAAAYSGTEVFEDFSQMDAMSIAVRDRMVGLDFLVSPVAPVAAFDAEAPSPRADAARALEHIGFTVPFSMSGHPAISVPWTTTSDGRPIGVQIVGRRFADLEVLRVGAACEALRPALPPWPTGPPPCSERPAL